ncbi:GreA/GreB family elongation factor [Flavobacterium sp. PL02]|jgi:regulator of nucleoside diphosphate kinase|uniref:GreA/GreB family elongation factor n=1 Tax=Flavobacterium sp. PL02 TaxID=3088354 RepID=UPI002B2236D7|nr:GreA/GreB family elongation factor [Flavobacterium sp. PL02]MEA9414776.1 GreA/GreB family elongation factor [Flavobacterium sp. PL02]
MENNKIIIEAKELELLKEIISTTQNNSDRIYNLSIKRLSRELETATVMAHNQMPEKIVRINSKVTVQIATNIIKNFQIVVPEKSNLNQNKLSVMSPMGLALYGYSINDEISWQFPSGINKLKILNVE